MESKHFRIQNQKLVNFIAGLFAGFISATVCNPLDIARTRLNVIKAPDHHENKHRYTHFSHAMKTIWKQQGLKGFYTGYRTNVVAIPLFHSIFFPIYEYGKKYARQKGFNESQATLSASVTAGTICNVLTNPIWVVRTRLMVQYLHPQKSHYTSNAPFHVIKQMIEAEGIQSLFKGLTASIFSVSNAVVYFYCYENMKKYLKKSDKVSLTNVFISSTISKIISSSLTYPFIVIRTVLYDTRNDRPKQLTNIIKHIVKRHGWIGFYAGLKPDLIRLIPSNAILFMVYEKAKQFL